MYPPASVDVPLRRIAAAVVGQAVADLRGAQPRQRKHAEAFIKSQSFTTWCGLTPLDPHAVRERLLVLRLTDEADKAPDQPPG